jgi:pilus assembly protein Flp/PilA
MINRIFKMWAAVKRLVVLTHAWHLCKDTTGAASVEYGILIAVIAAVVIAGATAVGTSVLNTFNDVATQLPGPAATP